MLTACRYEQQHVQQAKWECDADVSEQVHNASRPWEPRT